MATMRRIRHLWLFPFGADFLAITAAYYTLLFLRFHSEWGLRIFSFINRWLDVRLTGVLGENFERFYWVSAPRLIAILTLTLCVLYALRGLYDSRRFILRRPVLWNVLVANVVALGLFYAYFYLRRNTFHPRSFFGTFVVLNVFYCVVFRGFMNRFLQLVRERTGLDRSQAVLVGRGSGADAVYSLLDSRHPHGISVACRMQYDGGSPFEEWLKELGSAVSMNGADLIILAETDLQVSGIMEVLQLAGRLGIAVKVLSDKLSVLNTQAQIDTDMIQGVPLVHFDTPGQETAFTGIRKKMSLVLGFTLLVLTFPLMLIIAGLIKLTSRGPVFFKQERMGVDRKPFVMYKFRTMHDRAQEIQAQVEEFNESGEALFKIRKDPRVTPLGRILRRLSLDELPQLFNVIRGEMAVVGPRPLPRRDFENYYEEWHYNRHEGVPGLTCLWQVSGRSDVDFHNMCILDVYYLRNRNWILDLEIILRTFWAVLFVRGAY